MTKELQKRIITSLILLALLIFINFSNVFMFGVLIVGLIVCIEFSNIFRKLVGPMLVKHHPYSVTAEKFNFKFLSLNILAIFYVLI